jgi:hypothetical protein
MLQAAEFDGNSELLHTLDTVQSFKRRLHSVEEMRAQALSIAKKHEFISELHRFCSNQRVSHFTLNSLVEETRIREIALSVCVIAALSHVTRQVDPSNIKSAVEEGLEQLLEDGLVIFQRSSSTYCVVKIETLLRDILAILKQSLRPVPVSDLFVAMRNQTGVSDAAIQCAIDTGAIAGHVRYNGVNGTISAEP